MRRLRWPSAVLIASAVAGGCTASASTLPDASSQGSFTQQLSKARTEYFASIEGNGDAGSRAQEAFAQLEREHPGDPTVMAYSGSLELLEAAHTWAVWNKHKLATEGLMKLDRSVALAPDNLEVRFIHGETTWHLPFFYHRKEQAEQDFAFIAPRAESAAQQGTLPPQLAAEALNRYGSILEDHSDEAKARAAFQAAVRIGGDSPAARDASRHLR